jgi:hypothetical protein
LAQPSFQALWSDGVLHKLAAIRDQGGWSKPRGRRATTLGGCALDAVQHSRGGALRSDSPRRFFAAAMS